MERASLTRTRSWQSHLRERMFVGYPVDVRPAAEATVVVTGANGFIGRRVAALLSGRARNVRAGVRSKPDDDRPSSSGLVAQMSRVTLDVRDPDSLAAAFRGADVIVHCAVGDAESTVTGTRNVLSVARQEGVARVVHLSSAVVYGDASGVVDESAPLQSQGWRYAGWKIDCEDACRRAIEDGLDVVVLRPSIVYGPRALAWGAELGDRLRTGLWGTLGGFGEGTCNLVFIDDLVEAIWLCATAASAAGHSYNVNGPALPSWNEFFQMYDHALGYAPLVERNPALVFGTALAGTALRGAVRVARSVFRIGGRGPSLRTMRSFERSARLFPYWRDVRRLYRRKVTYVDAKLRRELGYQPLVSPERGAAEMARWYRAWLLEDEAAGDHQ